MDVFFSPLILWFSDNSVTQHVRRAHARFMDLSLHRRLAAALITFCWISINITWTDRSGCAKQHLLSWTNGCGHRAAWFAAL